MKHLNVAIAIVRRAGKILICQRKPDSSFAHHWEFPGGKQEPGESLEQCLARELMEELAIVAQPARALPIIEHQYPRALVRLHPFICDHTAGEPQPIECQQLRWIHPRQLDDYAFPPANAALLRDLIEILSTLDPT